ncbi:hypothetical protein F5Y09DRAFT_335933 [Xylaria sp. FL1042]|nr:hypothetical protein F5Y09DRAFT_335933 [Xylaria sp. FL1042]
MATPVISGTVRTNLGPLTTNTWSYTCTEVIQECGDCDVGWAAQTCIDGTVTDNTDCWPPRAGNVPKTSGAVLGWGIYSPGIVCPGGFTPVAAATHGGSSDFEFQYPLSAGETAIGCCPKDRHSSLVIVATSGFSPIQDPNRYQTCVQFKPTTTFLVGSCGTDGPTYTPFSIGGTLNSTQYNSFSVSAPFIQVVYQASDMPRESTTQSPTSSSSSSSSSNPSTASQPNSPSPESNKSTALSPGATAGIVIGAILGAIFIATATFCLWRARKRRASPRQAAEFVPPEFKPFAPASVAYGQDNIAMGIARHDGIVPSGLVEVNPNHPAELAGRPQPVELGSLYRNEIART